MNESVFVIGKLNRYVRVLLCPSVAKSYQNDDQRLTSDTSNRKRHQLRLISRCEIHKLSLSDGGLRLSGFSLFSLLFSTPDVTSFHEFIGTGVWTILSV